LITAHEVKTTQARRIIPARVSRLEAVETCANACSITAAFASHNYHHLRESFGDHLHQPFRKKLIPFLSCVIAAAEDAGALGAFLSGSGSTIAAVTLKDPQKVAEAMRREIDNCNVRVLITRADNTGARFLKSPITNH
jgi:homoserine kinase